MSIKDFIPDHWISIFKSLKAQQRIGYKVKHPIIKAFIDIILPIIIGGSLFFISDLSINPNIITIAITVLGVLSGFLMSLMLFSGKVSGSELLTFEQSKEYRDLILFLLKNQTITFIIYVITMVIGLLILLVPTEFPFIYILDFLFTGFLLLCFLKSIVIPYQLFDLHKFSLERLVDKAQKEEQDEINKLMHSNKERNKDNQDQ